MQAGYYKTAWNDLKNSQGWFKKLLLLGLIMFIPIFGPIVVYGYLYGWARDIAWNIHSPLPQRIFGNEDGKLYTRGFYILVVALAFAVIPWVLEMIQSAIFGAGIYSFLTDYSTGRNSWGGMLAYTGIFSMLFSLVIFVVQLALSFFQWVADMRVSIYGELSAGFHFGQIWKMLRHDFSGLLRIFGMSLIIGLIIGVIFAILLSIIIGIIIAGAGTAAYGGSGRGSSGAAVGAVVGLSLLSVVLILVVSYMFIVGLMYTMALITRALGYWTRQFDVPNWKGPKDPLPFESQIPQQTYPNQPPTQPFAQQPPVQQPFAQQPPVQQPFAQQPPVQQPPVQQPTGEQPPVQQPPVGQPVTGQPPVEQPVAGQPATEQPSPEQPPVQQPPAEQAPVQQAPTEQPLDQQPPAEQPPAGQQPPTPQ